MRKTVLYVTVLFKMSRPAQLAGITLVYVLGLLIALANGAEWNTSSMLVAYFIAIPISISIHYVNEYADFESDALASRTPFSGGSGALPQSGLPRQIAWRAAWVALLIGTSLALAAYFLAYLSLPALTLLALSAFFGWMYSLPPLRLAWRGWGELDNALLGGIALPVYAYAAISGRVDIYVILVCIPFGMLVFVNLLATTWPDRHADAQVGKFTLAARWQVTSLRLLYLGVAVIGYAYLLIVPIFPPLVIMASLLTIPISLWGALTYTRWHTPLPTVAAMTAMLVAQIYAWGVQTGLFYDRFP